MCMKAVYTRGHWPNMYVILLCDDYEMPVQRPVLWGGEALTWYWGIMMWICIIHDMIVYTNW